MMAFEKTRYSVSLTALICCLVPCGAVTRSTAEGTDSRGPSSGVLYISGGGNRKEEGLQHSREFRFPAFVALVREASSKESPKIVVITTAGGREQNGKHRSTLRLKELVGENNVTEQFTRDREVANSDAFLDPINEADGIWMIGGQQGVLAGAFLGTKTESALGEVLARGGVIGGSSAGAQFQSSFMTRGMENMGKTGPILGDGENQQGLGFISHSAFDVHVAVRDRQKDLFELFATDPGSLQNQDLDPMELLGIGIDEMTAVIVRQDQIEVVGKAHVYIFNPWKWNDTTPPFYDTLSAGDRYDIKERKKIN